MEEINLNTIDGSILHDIQLMDTRMVSLHCNVNEKEVKEDNIKTNISIVTQGNAVTDRIGESIIRVNVVSEVFELEITQLGRFEKNSELEISKESFEKFLATQGIRLLWSFVRENVYEISCKMLRKPIMLPTLDVMKALKKK